MSQSSFVAANDTFHRAYIGWSIARLCIGCTMLIFATTPYLYSGRHISSSLLILLALAFLMMITSLSTAVMISMDRDITKIVPYIVVFDTLIGSGVVYISGGPSSPLTLFHGANVIISAMVIGPKAPYPIAFGSSSLYVFTGLALSKGWLPIPADQSISLYKPDTADLAFSLISNVTGILFVAILASILSERLKTTGGELARTTQKAEELSRFNNDIVRSISSGLITSNLKGYVLTANKSAADILGFQEDQLLNRNIHSMLPLGADDTNLLTPQHRAEGIATRADGSTFPVGFTISPLRNTQNEQTGTLFLFQDLTEVRKLAEIARTAERMASLGKIAAGLAHEIRNPLSSISGSVELVRESSSLDREDKKLLSIVLSEAERLNDLVTTMLDFSKPRQPKLSDVDISQIVNEIAQVAKVGLCYKAGIYLEVEKPLEPVIAYADADLIRQVIWNLLKNAIQASAQDTQIIMRTEVSDNCPLFEILDEGSGLGDNPSEQLFEMFQSGRTHGTGIGLALVKRIIDDHHGKIIAQNRKPRGASFTIQLPSYRGTHLSA